MRINRDKATLSKNRWAAYAAAGAAGAVAALGPQASVDAQITVNEVGANLVDRTQGDGYFDVFGPYTFGAAGASFILQQAFNETASGEGQLLVIGSGAISFVGAQAGAYFYPANLAYGQNVSTAGAFDVTAGQRGDMAWGNGYNGSQFLDAGTGYLGFQFDVGNGTQYGYVEFDLDGAPTNTAVLTKYAYADAGATIFAGQTAIPEPGALGLLALGSTALLTWRRRRSA